MDFLTGISSFQLKSTQLTISGLQERQSYPQIILDLQSILKFLGLLYCDDLLTAALKRQNAGHLNSTENSTSCLTLDLLLITASSVIASFTIFNTDLTHLRATPALEKGVIQFKTYHRTYEGTWLETIETLLPSDHSISQDEEC
jgi:hypothetical protein